MYVENYGRYDWTRYFTGHAGLDLRWTKAKHLMWKRRFEAVGASKTHVEVWWEDGSRRGDEEWEEHLSAHFSNSSIRWIHVRRHTYPPSTNPAPASALSALVGAAEATA